MVKHKKKKKTEESVESHSNRLPLDEREKTAHTRADSKQPRCQKQPTIALKFIEQNQIQNLKQAKEIMPIGNRLQVAEET